MATIRCSPVLPVPRAAAAPASSALRTQRLSAAPRAASLPSKTLRSSRTSCFASRPPARRTQGRDTPGVTRASAGEAASTGESSDGGEEEATGGIKGWWKKNAAIDKSKLASLGTSVLLSYGFVSNVNAISLMLIAFVSFGKAQGVSPLAAGMWPKFLGVYTLLYASIGNLLRPLRVALSISISPFFDRFVDVLMKKLNVKKPVAFGCVVFLVNICGSFTYLIGGAFLVSLIFGVPLIP